MGCSASLCGIGNDPEVMRGRHAAFVRIEDVHPSEFVAIEGVDADPDLLPQAENRALPFIEGYFVVLRHVIEDDENARERILHDSGDCAVPTDVISAEGQSPAAQPTDTREWGRRGSLRHPAGIQVDPIRCVDRHRDDGR